MNRSLLHPRTLRMRMNELLIRHLSRGVTKGSTMSSVIRRGVENMTMIEVRHEMAKLGISCDGGKRPHKFPIEVRYIYDMMQMGMDHTAVVEMLCDEYDEMSKEKIEASVEPVKDLAAKWYENGASIIHGLILGWMIAAEK